MYGRVLFTVALISVFVQGFDLWSLTVISIALLALAAAGTLGAFDRSERIQAGAIGLILVLLSLWLFLSARLSPLTAVAGIGMYQQLVLPLAFLAFLIAPDQDDSGRQLALLSGGLCILLSLMALAEPFFSQFPTFSAFFVQRNSLSGYLLLLSFILLPVLGHALRDGVSSRTTAVAWCMPIFLSLFLVCFTTSRACRHPIRSTAAIEGIVLKNSVLKRAAISFAI